MSSNDRRNEPIGGESVPARAQPVRPDSATEPPADNGVPRVERPITRPSARVGAVNPKRPVSHLSQRVPSPIPQPVTVDDSGSIATVADTPVTHDDTPTRSASTNGMNKDAASTNGPIKGNGTTQKRRPQKAAASRNGNRAQNRNGAASERTSKVSAVIFDPGMIRAAPASPELLAEPDLEPDIELVGEPVVDAHVDSAVDSVIDSNHGESSHVVADRDIADRDIADHDIADHVDSHRQAAVDAAAESSLIERIVPTPSAETVVAELTITTQDASTTLEVSDPETPEIDSRLDGHETVDGDASDPATTNGAPSRPKRKPLFAGLVQRVKDSLTIPTPVVMAPPGTPDGRVGELPPPLAPPILQPLAPVSLPEVITPASRVSHAPAPTALQPQVPDVPSPTRLFPATTIGIDTARRARPNYIDADDDGRAMIPTIKRPVRSTAPAGRRRPRIRRVTRVVRHVDPWSVFKVAVCFSTVLYGVCLTAGVLLWNVANTTGTIDNIERFFESFGWDRFEFKGGELYHSAWIAGLFAAVGLAGLIVLAATLFNLITDLVGGIRVTVLEEEVVERDPAKRRPALRGRRLDLKPVIDPFDPDAPLESLDAMRNPTVEPVWVEPARDLQR